MVIRVRFALSQTILSTRHHDVFSDLRGSLTFTFKSLANDQIYFAIGPFAPISYKIPQSGGLIRTLNLANFTVFPFLMKIVDQPYHFFKLPDRWSDDCSVALMLLLKEIGST